jgi:hypothetical protein
MRQKTVKNTAKINKKTFTSPVVCSNIYECKPLEKGYEISVNLEIARADTLLGETG